LEGRPFEHRLDLIVIVVDDLLDRPRPAIGIQPPDRTEPPARDWSVREPSRRPEIEGAEQRGNVAFRERDPHDSINSATRERVKSSTSFIGRIVCQNQATSGGKDWKSLSDEVRRRATSYRMRAMCVASPA
jgi:hypothetical protein